MAGHDPDEAASVTVIIRRSLVHVECRKLDHQLSPLLSAGHVLPWPGPSPNRSIEWQRCCRRLLSELLASSHAEPGDRASRTSGSGVRTVDLLPARGEH